MILFKKKSECAKNAFPMRAASQSHPEIVTPEQAAAPRRRDLAGVARALARLFALQDMIFLAYLAFIGALIGASPAGPIRTGCARVVYVSAAVLVAGCLVARGVPALPRVVRAVIYRVAIVGVLLSNYLTLRNFLQLVRPDAVDDALLRFDLRVFGVEPALWLERFNQRPIVEWFSFFYFSYFAIGAAYMITVVWLSRAGRKTAEFAIGTAIVFCVGQLGYTAVPGYGPIKHLESSFHGPIEGGFWWSMVWSTVQAAGAMKDIFPSLHTAVPFWFTLFALHQARSDARWRWPARVTGFFSANIIVSTMLLRWHYGIDVVMGIVLASTAGFLAPRLARREEEWRHALGYPAPWHFPETPEPEAPSQRPS
jgi:PAP2 superfamily